MNEGYNSKDISLDTIKNHIIEELKEQYARGLLEEAEFETLVERTENVRSKNELARLAEELPDLRGSSQTDKKSGPDGYTGHKDRHFHGEAHSGGAVRAEDTIITVLGEGGRYGVWRPPNRLKVLTIMGDTDIDFTDAEIYSRTIFVDIFALMADIDIIVPPGFIVEFSGVPLLSSFKNKTEGGYGADAPRIKISGFALMADVMIKESKR